MIFMTNKGLTKGKTIISWNFNFFGTTTITAKISKTLVLMFTSHPVIQSSAITGNYFENVSDAPILTSPLYFHVKSSLCSWPLLTPIVASQIWKTKLEKMAMKKMDWSVKIRHFWPPTPPGGRGPNDVGAITSRRCRSSQACKRDTNGDIKNMRIFPKWRILAVVTHNRLMHNAFIHGFWKIVMD